MGQMRCVFWHAVRYGTLYTVIAVLSVLLYYSRGKNNPTLPSVLPSLSNPPYTTAIGTSYTIVQWQEQHTGDGPICAYAIDRSFGDDIPSWLTVGIVSGQPGSLSREELIFNVTGLEPDTGYQVSVRPILCDGTRASELGEGPILSVTTPSIVLPTLVEAPQSTKLSSTNVAIRWTKQHQGDGPICGYEINIKKNDDIDRGDDDDDSDPWSSVGYVSVESELLYDIGNLEANTTYQVAVSPINCISAREGPREPILQFTTTTVALPVVVLPSLSHPPNTTAIGTSYTLIKWEEQHTGDGPICAYAIDRRSFGFDIPSWLTVGFVSAQPGSQSREEFIFNVTGLEPNTGYQVSVRPILCDGARTSELGEGPILYLTTLSIVLPTLMEAPQSTKLSSTNVGIRWTNQHQGDGPICGYGINIKKNDDKDDGDDDDSDPWRSAGYVSVESELLYDIGHLGANTTYQVAVSPINCISAREGPREPILQFTTKTVTPHVVVLPSLSHPPNATAIGTSYALIQWEEQHIGDGPICAYLIDRKSFGDEIPSWLTVGFVSAQPGSQSREELIFNVIGLEPDTGYQVSVRPILCDGARTSELGEGPILYLTTLSIEVQTTEPLITAPQKTEPKRDPLSGGSVWPEPNCTVVVVVLILGYYLTKRQEK